MPAFMAHGNSFTNSINGSPFICCTCTITGMFYLLGIPIRTLYDLQFQMSYISNLNRITITVCDTPLKPIIIYKFLSTITGLKLINYGII